MEHIYGCPCFFYIVPELDKKKYKFEDFIYAIVSILIRHKYNEKEIDLILDTLFVNYPQYASYRTSINNLSISTDESYSNVISNLLDTTSLNIRCNMFYKNFNKNTPCCTTCRFSTRYTNKYGDIERNIIAYAITSYENFNYINEQLLKRCADSTVFKYILDLNIYGGVSRIGSPVLIPIYRHLYDTLYSGCQSYFDILNNGENISGAITFLRKNFFTYLVGILGAHDAIFGKTTLFDLALESIIADLFTLSFSEKFTKENADDFMNTIFGKKVYNEPIKSTISSNDLDIEMYSPATTNHDERIKDDYNTTRTDPIHGKPIDTKNMYAPTEENIKDMEDSLQALLNSFEDDYCFSEPETCLLNSDVDNSTIMISVDIENTEELHSDIESDIVKISQEDKSFHELDKNSVEQQGAEDEHKPFVTSQPIIEHPILNDLPVLYDFIPNISVNNDILASMTRLDTINNIEELENGITKNKQFSIEAVSADQCDILIIYSKHTKNKFFYLLLNEDALAISVLEAYISRKLYAKICFSSYKLYAVLSKYNLPAKNIFSIQSAYSLLSPTNTRCLSLTGLFTYICGDDYFDNCDFPYSKTMKKYGTIRVFLLKELRLRQLESVFDKQCYFESLIGASYELNKYFPEQRNLFSLTGCCKYRFNSYISTYANKPGIFFQYVISPEYSYIDSCILSDLLLYFSFKGYFKKHPIQICQLTKRKLCIFVLKDYAYEVQTDFSNELLKRMMMQFKNNIGNYFEVFSWNAVVKE